MDFVADTVRLTPLSSQMLVVERAPLVLSGVSVRIAAGRERLLADVLATGVLMPRRHPEMWRKLEVTVTDLPAGLSAPDAGNLVRAITRTSHVALEAWSSPCESEGPWPYAVVPWFDTQSVGASVATSRDWMEFGGDLFESCWWAGGETWHDTLVGAISTERFVPLVPVEEGALWGLGTTTTPPPAATSLQEREALRAHDVQWQREKYGAYV
ncbi:hypothetical protein ABZ896_10125 [Streptomyces sp. NPDC047072]|uniref:hypothetical protein n=1 Tax=Streptomyces sp. NPDC047072 TaxID=3154809 RepID=UPI0033E1B9D5